MLILFEKEGINQTHFQIIYQALKYFFAQRTVSYCSWDWRNQVLNFYFQSCSLFFWENFKAEFHLKYHLLTSLFCNFPNQLRACSYKMLCNSGQSSHTNIQQMETNIEQMENFHSW